MSRRKAQYVLQRHQDVQENDTASEWKEIEDIEIHSVAEAIKLCKQRQYEGTFRVIAIKAEFIVQEETRLRVKMS